MGPIGHLRIIGGLKSFYGVSGVSRGSKGVICPLQRLAVKELMHLSIEIISFRLYFYFMNKCISESCTIISLVRLAHN